MMLSSESMPEPLVVIEEITFGMQSIAKELVDKLHLSPYTLFSLGLLRYKRLDLFLRREGHNISFHYAASLTPYGDIFDDFGNYQLFQQVCPVCGAIGHVKEEINGGETEWEGRLEGGIALFCDHLAWTWFYRPSYINIYYSSSIGRMNQSALHEANVKYATEGSATGFMTGRKKKRNRRLSYGLSIEKEGKDEQY